MAAPTEEASHSMEKHFAQHLAANETKIRDRAVRKISRWITAKSRKDSGMYARQNDEITSPLLHRFVVTCDIDYIVLHNVTV